MERTEQEEIARRLEEVKISMEDDRRYRLAAKLSEHLRMTIYSYLTGEETVKTVRNLSKREKRMIEASGIAREGKQFIIRIYDKKLPITLPTLASILKVVSSVTFKINGEIT